MAQDMWLSGFFAGVAFTWPVASAVTLIIGVVCRWHADRKGTKAMTSPRARLLAILKEPEQYGIGFFCGTGCSYAFIQDRDGHIVEKMATNAADLEPRRDELNASYRLKRLCEEMAKANKNSPVICAMEAVIEGECNGLAIDRSILQQAFEDAILAIGEPNEHS